MESIAPTVLWRLFRRARPSAAPRSEQNVRAVILPGGPPYTLAFFADNELDRAENYDDISLALFRADEIKRSLLEDGWKDDHE